MFISLYKTSDSNNTLYKTLNNQKQLEGVMRAECSVINPKIVIETSDNISTFNYVHIPEFNRYYFIVDITSVSEHLWEISLRCDVLMSYRESIINLDVNVLRNQREFNLMLNDNQLPVYADDRVQVYNFERTLTVTPGQYHYYLTVIGGGE
jgi:hypothetical protein